MCRQRYLVCVAIDINIVVEAVDIIDAIEVIDNVDTLATFTMFCL